MSESSQIIVAIVASAVGIGGTVALWIQSFFKTQAKKFEDDRLKRLKDDDLARERERADIKSRLDDTEAHRRRQDADIEHNRAMLDVMRDLIKQGGDTQKLLSDNTAAVNDNTASANRTADGLAELVAQVQKMHSSVTQTLDMVNKFDRAGITTLKQQFEAEFAALEKTLLAHIQARAIRETNETPISGANGTGGA